MGVKGVKTLAVLSSEFALHASQISAWKGRLLTEGPQLFDAASARQQLRAHEQREAELYEQIGRLQMELEFLKKKVAQ